MAGERRAGSADVASGAAVTANEGAQAAKVKAGGLDFSRCAKEPADLHLIPRPDPVEQACNGIHEAPQLRALISDDTNPLQTEFQPPGLRLHGVRLQGTLELYFDHCRAYPCPFAGAGVLWSRPGPHP